MKLVAYIRVSGAGQVADGYGLDVQEEAVTRWAAGNGHQIVKLIREEGVSGTKDAEDREGLSEALAMLRDREADGLLLPKLDRLARDLMVQEATLALAWQHGGAVFTTDGGEVLQDDPDDPMRSILRKFVGLMAELDRMVVVKRMRDGRKAKAQTGRKSVGAYAYGTHGQGEGRERDAAPNPAEARTVARILELRAAGKSYRAIGELLDAEGLRPRRAERWNPVTISDICKRHAAA
jgi:DNA invertase Pin-like site-specific DNA recombinase